MDYPLVSIGVPVFNASRFIISTLESINNQAYANIEIIIVDDCSTDDSYKVVCKWAKKSKFPIKILKNEINLGLTKSCNVLFRNARGKYFQKLDSDDVIYPSKIQDQVKLFEQGKHEIAMVFSNAELINESGDKIQEEYYDRIGFKPSIVGNESQLFIQLLKKNFIPNPSPLLLSKAIKEVGGYDEKLFFEDWDMWLKISRNYKCMYQEEKTCAYRIRKGSMESLPSNFIRKNDSIVKIFKKYLRIELPYRKIVWESLHTYTVYSFYLGDNDARNKMWWYLNNKFDIKMAIYFLLSSLGLKHPSNYLRKSRN